MKKNDEIFSWFLLFFPPKKLSNSMHSWSWYTHIFISFDHQNLSVWRKSFFLLFTASITLNQENEKAWWDKWTNQALNEPKMNRLIYNLVKNLFRSHTHTHTESISKELYRIIFCLSQKFICCYRYVPTHHYSCCCCCCCHFDCLFVETGNKKQQLQTNNDKSNLTFCFIYLFIYFFAISKNQT